MIPLHPRPRTAGFWNPNSGHWMPTHRRVTPPRRWLRYPLAIILLASAICSARPLAWGEATEPTTWHGPCHKGASIVALPLFTAVGEGDGNDR